MSYWGCVIARNAKDTISATLQSILNQSGRPQITIVADDGSTDDTASIISVLERRHIGTLKVLRLPDKGYDIRRVPANINAARKLAKQLAPKAEFCFISGDDCVYPTDYCETLLGEFRSNPKLAIASGVTDGIRPVAGERMPSGSGRMVNEHFWREVGGEYPSGYGWEAWLPFKAVQMGYELSSVPKLRFTHLRQSGSQHGFRNWGVAMRTLGYYPPYAVGRCIKNAFFSGSFGEFRGHLSTLRAYLTGPERQDPFSQTYDLAFRNFVANLQKARMKRLLGF